MSRDDGATAGRSALLDGDGANDEARKELLAYSHVLSFGSQIRDRSCEGCTEDEVQNDHPAELTESLAADTPWAHRFLKKAELYQGQNSGKAAVGADCYYTHTVAWCNAQNAQGAGSRAMDVKSHSDGLSAAQKKEQALAMDGANDYDMDCFYHHEVSWCLKLHAKEKAARQKQDFVLNAERRTYAYGSDPELAGLAKMVHSSESSSERREDERFRMGGKKAQEYRSEGGAREHLAQEKREAREEREEREAREERKAQENEDKLRHALGQREERKERKERKEREERREEREERVRREAREARAQPQQRVSDSMESQAGDDTDKLTKLEVEAAREKSVAEQELQEQLVAEQKEAAAEAQLKAAKAQLHALASSMVAKSDKASRMPALRGLPVNPSLENAEPVEVRPKEDVPVPRADVRSRSSASERDRRMQRLHDEYKREMVKKEDMSYPLSVRRQEPDFLHNLDVTSSAISWDKAHGVRAIDELKQRVRIGRETELADSGLADFTVNAGDMTPAAHQRDQPSELEKEALSDGLTLVPLQGAAGGASSLVNKGLSEDGKWESKEGLRLVSSRGSARQSHPASMLSSQSLLRRQEQRGNSWERSHGMIPFTSHQQEHSSHTLLSDEQVSANAVQPPASDSSLAMRAVAEADQVGAAGIRALGFSNAKDFERHLEKEGV